MKILKRIALCAVAVLLAVGAIFVPKTSKPAHADVTTYPGSAFTSSNILFCEVAGLNYGESFNNNFNNFHYLNNNVYNFYSFSFRTLLDENNYYKLQFQAYSDDYTFISSSNVYNSWSDIASFSTLGYGEINVNLGFSDFFDVYVFSSSGPSATHHTRFGYSIQYIGSDEVVNEFPSMSMKSVEIGNSSNFNFSAHTNFDFTILNNCNVISYITMNDYRITFFIPYWNTSSINPFYSYRKYFIYNNLTNNDIYDQGYSAGYNDSYDLAFNNGYREGTITGFDNGYSEGVIDGATNSNSYSFFGLITAVIDAPVRVLASLFNFNFLGINLWLFITSILTISLVIFVIRKFMGKG